MVEFPYEFIISEKCASRAELRFVITFLPRETPQLEDIYHESITANRNISLFWEMMQL